MLVCGSGYCVFRYIKFFSNWNPRGMIEDEEEKHVIFSTEVLLQAMFTLSFGILALFCEYYLGESLYGDKFLLIITFIWIHLPSILLFFDLKHTKVKLLICTAIIHCILLYMIFIRRCKLIVLIQNETNPFSEHQLGMALEKFNTFPYAFLLIVGKTVKQEMLNICQLKNTFYNHMFNKYLINTGKVKYTIEALLKNNDFTNLTGHYDTVIFIFETENSCIKKIFANNEQFQL